MKNIFFLLLFFILSACNNGNRPIPKPPTFLRVDLPKKEYTIYKNEACNYSFPINKAYGVKDVEGSPCHKDIHLGKLNGIIHFSFIKMKEPLSVYVNYVNDKVDEHKIKATAINDYKFIDSTDRIYGILFELEGDVASPFQFYLTDSTKYFASGAVYFNSVPNYDSLKPTLNYLKEDLNKLIEEFKWL